MKNQVVIFDTTLRDGEQAPGASMTVPEKVRIAEQLAKLKVDVIEAGFPISSPGQFEAVARVVRDVKGPVICGLARALESDVRSAGKALAGGERTRIHTFIATSDIHIDAKFSEAKFGRTLKDKRRTIVRMAHEAVQLARTYTSDVEFSAEDAGRTDHGYLCEVISAAVEAGATTINIPDTTGYCTPTEYAAMFEAAWDCIPDGAEVVLSAHCHDDLGLAVANSIAAVRAGARQIECTVNGIGERAGNAALEEVVMALRVRAEQFGVDTGIESTHLTETSRIVSVATGFPVPPNKAIVGRNAFSHEAGIHQHGVLKRRDTYEIMSAADVGQTAEQIRLGRHSGRHGFFSRLERLGLNVEKGRKDTLYRLFVQLADRKKEIFDEDLIHLVRGNEDHVVNPHYSLEKMSVSVGTGKQPEAEVEVLYTRTGERRSERGTGDGPVDAVYRAINHAVGSTHELESYSIRSVSEGADAIGEVTVLVGENGAYFKGRAQHTDVIQASADAYIDALNHLEAYRSDEENMAFVGNGIMRSFQGGAA
jgi:2-isopropylmalate synthase